MIGYDKPILGCSDMSRKIVKTLFEETVHHIFESDRERYYADLSYFPDMEGQCAGGENNFCVMSNSIMRIKWGNRFYDYD